MISTALLRDIKKSIWNISTDDGNLARFNLFNIDQYVENTMSCAKNTFFYLRRTVRHINVAYEKCFPTSYVTLHSASLVEK